MATSIINKVVTEVVTERKAATLDADTLSALAQFVATRDAIRDLEKTKKELEASIREALGDAEVGVNANGEITVEVSLRERKGVDTKALAEAFPEAYEACQTLTEYSVLVAK